MEEKDVEKKGKREKWFGKSPFCFCLTVSLPLPFFFPCTHHTTTPQHMHTHSPTHHTPYNKTHRCTPSHANRAVCCAAFFWEWTARHTLHHPHPTLHHLTLHTTHTNQPNTDTVHDSSNKETTIVSEKGIGQRAKSGTTQQNQHTD